MVADKTGTRELAMPDDLKLPPEPQPDTHPSRRLSHFEIGPFTRLCETLRDRIDGKASRSPIAPASFHDGLACMKIMDAMRVSSASDGALQIIS